MNEKFNEIFDSAIDNYGLVTSSRLSNMNVSRTQTQRYINDGRLTRVGRGLYRIGYYTPVPQDIYAEAVLLVDEDACLYGASVLAMLELGLLNPSKIYVATTKRIRKELPKWIKVKKVNDINKVMTNGICCQKTFDALMVAKRCLMHSRFEMAVDQAYKNGYINIKEKGGLCILCGRNIANI